MQAEQVIFGEIYKKLTFDSQCLCPTKGQRGHQKSSAKLSYPGHLFEVDVSKDGETPDSLKMQF